MSICKFKNFPGLYPRTPVNREGKREGRKKGREEKGKGREGEG
jgi:hypothetical protein